MADGTIGLVGGGHDDPYWVAWYSPDPRPVICAGHVHLGRNLRKQLRRSDTDDRQRSFGRVAEECRADREPRWLTDALLETLIELHREGWAHSIEVWLDGELVGGAIGIGIGPFISGDSLFSRHPGAGRVAVADMAARFALPAACSSTRSGTAPSSGRSAPNCCRESVTCRCWLVRLNGQPFPLSRSPRGGLSHLVLGRFSARIRPPAGLGGHAG